MASLRLPPFLTIKDIVKLYRLSAIKQLSQNFLLDDKLTNKIVKCAGKIHNSQVLEVGPGPGGITRSIIRKLPRKLIVIEKDKRFLPVLNMLKEPYCASERQMEIILDDIMNVNMEKLFDEEKKEWFEECPNICIIGNLPFNVSTPLIIKWLHAISERKGAWANGRVKMVLTFQKEVAERLVAQVSEDQRCRLSIMAQTWTNPKLRFIIPGKAFVPKPDVDVGVVSFTPLKVPLTSHEFKFFEKINRHLFSFRQKYCKRCIKTLFPPDCQEQLSMLMCKLADVNPETRPYNLTIENIDKLASAYKYICEKHPEIEYYNYRASRKILESSYTQSVVIEDYLENNDNELLMNDNEIKKNSASVNA